jgi:cytoskeleton protein RodZ
VFEIGTSLREARMRKQIELPEAEQGTKIRAKYLRALEDEQFELLPAQPYVKGFLRSYAEYLGLDGQLYVDEYNSRYVIGEDAGGEQPFRSRRRDAPRARTRAHRRYEKSVVLLALGAIVAIAALVFAAFRFSGSPSSQKIPNLGSGRTATPTASRATAAGLLVVRAVRGPVTLQIHRGGPAGKLLFQGTLDAGRRVTFATQTVWVGVDRPEHLRVIVDHRTLRLPQPNGPTQLTISRAGKVRIAAA